MRHTLYVLLFMLVMFASVVGDVHAESFTSKQLIDGANYFNDGKVRYKGEAVTAIMNRGSHSWVNLNDGANAIGIWCETKSLKDVRYIGDYKNKGDVLEVEGVFHRACPMHGGELDIHADSVKIVSVGHVTAERFPVKRIRVAAAFFILTLLAIIILIKRI